MILRDLQCCGHASSSRPRLDTPKDISLISAAAAAAAIKAPFFNLADLADNDIENAGLGDVCFRVVQKGVFPVRYVVSKLRLWKLLAHPEHINSSL